MNDPQVLFEQLLKAESETDADAILRRAGYSLDNEADWRPLGDMENNFSTRAHLSGLAIRAGTVGASPSFDA